MMAEIERKFSKLHLNLSSTPNLFTSFHKPSLIFPTNITTKPTIFPRVLPLV
jgi:hypothetical protein